ncbi:hypothetical protein [Nonomuraea rhodomycinica]|uniref:Uncharacterized protein n=1 Tax=Nonomuraea rhodomycinica TaxID=1712872 RepID=A0A7Y6IWQ5_9ACTN|nr:hypothetical protein [Nonomuraea rhodomycinica]NUW45772.1 hypothetical protein [Nonomuraea rhodomycinica]
MSDEQCVQAADLSDSPDWECPAVSPHPARARANHTVLAWTALAPERSRVQEFTCACTAVYYELIAHSGAYLIHKVTQLDTPVHAFAGPWPHAEARRWWSLLIVGDAR